FNALAATHEMPFYAIAGNHDPEFTTYVGPDMFSFDAGEYHFVAFYRAGDEVNAWLARDIAANADKKLIVLNHWCAGTNPRSPYSPIKKSGLLPAKPLAWLSGNDHINYAYPFLGTLDIRTSSFNQGRRRDATPKGYRIITLDEKGVRDTTYYPTGIPATAGVSWPADGAVVSPGKLSVRACGISSGSFALGARCRIVPAGGEPPGEWVNMTASGAFRFHADVEVAESGPHRVALAVDFGLPGAERPVRTVTSRAEFSVGRPAALTPDGKPAFPLRLAWSSPVGGMVYGCRPTVIDGKVLIGSRRDDRSDFAGVTALELAGGKRLWRAPVGDVKYDVLAHGQTAYFISSRNKLHAVDLAGGKEKGSVSGLSGWTCYLGRSETALGMVSRQSWAAVGAPTDVHSARVKA
ncbi:hypothetical protein LCGC14_2810400, partial [marine sediment metagenome]